MKNLIKIITIGLLLIVGPGCVYYNTFYLAKKAFKEGEAKRKEADLSSYRVGASSYKRAIEKTDKILEKYPSSKWYDDALYVNGVSHYWTDNYSKSQRRFRELIANFPESKYIKEARLYLAKSKLKLDEVEDANALFEELFSGSEEKWIKADAAFSLGLYYVDEKEYEKAEPYFMSLVDSLGDTDQRNLAKMYIADGLYDRFKYRQAMEAYQELLDFDLTLSEQYKVKFRIGECLLFLNDFEDGLEIFFELRDNDLYYDSLPSTKLMIAQGYEWDGDMDMAETIYEEIALESPRSKQGALSNYILGLIYQFDYEDYQKAKEYYDNAKSAGASSGIYQDALLRSSNIGKLEEYQKMEFRLDSSSTQDEVDNAAETQYLLAELYLTQMNKPDSALKEFRVILDNFSDSYLAPKTLIAMAQLHRDYHADTTKYDSALRVVLKEYPRSDFIPEAIDLLGLSGTTADTGYAALYYHKSEYFIYDNFNLDSAQYYMSIVADSFPYSQLNEKAKFALLWFMEEYDSPGDSTLYYAYYHYSDSFPDTKFGKAASDKIIMKPKFERDEEEFPMDTMFAAGDSLGGELYSDTAEDTTRFLSIQEICQKGPDGKVIWEVQELPIRYDKEFRFPQAAYAYDLPDYFDYYFQIRIDPFGDISDIKLLNPTPSEELNEETTETILSCHFNTSWILPEFTDSWWCFKYRITLPTR